MDFSFERSRFLAFLENLENCAVFQQDHTHSPLHMGHGISRVSWSPLCLLHPLTTWSRPEFEATDKARRQQSQWQHRPEAKPLVSLFRALLCHKDQVLAPGFTYQCILVFSTLRGTSEELNTYFLTHGWMDGWKLAVSMAEGGRSPFLFLPPLPPSPKTFTDRSIALLTLSLSRTCQMQPLWQGLKLST